MWLRYKSLDSRFTNTVRATLARPEEVFTNAELDKLRQFCRQFGLQYGELDIIRHAEDGRIYILDANNTPWSPAASAAIPKAQLDWVLQRSAEAFRDSYLG
jgi:Holliday junction resolvase-like predicted endonuclease